MPGAVVPTVELHRRRAPRMMVLAAGAAILGAAAAGGAAMLRHRSPAAPSAVSANARRVVVAVFENRTGDPSLGPLGDIVADYLSRGLAETRLVDVIDARAEQSGNGSAYASGIARALSLVRELGGGSVLWGAYARQGDSLRFEAQLTDAATGKPLAAILPAAGSAGQQTQGVEALRQHVMSALAERFDPRLARFVGVSASHAVSYDAYREFLAGDTIQVYGGCDPCLAIAIAHYRRAYALDTNFTLPLVEIAGISAFAGPCERTDSIADVLRPRHDRLPPFDRLQLDWVVAKCHGQSEKVLEILRQAMAAAPRSELLVSRYARVARLVGRLHEAIAMTERLDPKRHERDLFYWGNRAIAYHMLGEHQRELELAQEARRVLPGNMEVLGWEAHAFVGLGRLTDVNALVDKAARVPLEVPQVQAGLVSFLTDVGRDLRAHGYPEPARAVFERGIHWIKAHPATEQRDPGLQADLSGLLYDAQRYEEAWPILQQLAAKAPDELDLQAALGAVAARRGDRKEVARIDHWLAQRTGRYLKGAHTFNRARLAAILGDRDRAVELYRLALDQGYALDQGGYFGHADPAFESLRDYPPFQELTRPKD
jgi:tetratricopeptide (TPR) repeat protein